MRAIFTYTATANLSPVIETIVGLTIQKGNKTYRKKNSFDLCGKWRKQGNFRCPVTFF